ncbi:UNVERIFIED_CONTAM: hypothetical protein GTU68_021300 [Idotea baltica]|nr:hypothetical protein [Idotea baltica]
MLLEEAGYQVDTDKVPQDKLAEVLPDYNVVIVRSATKIRKDLIDLCPKLEIIARAGVGLDNIDYDYAKEKGKMVFNTPAASSQSVAELAFAHMFGLARFLHQSNQALRADDADFKALKKAYSKGYQLRGKTLGVIGFGRIGQETARIGLALGMNVMPVDIFIDEADIEVETYDMDEMLAKADMISLHVPFAGKALVGKEEIAKAKDGVVIINAARGGTVDEDALLEGLESGKVGAAGLDVFEDEPNPKKALLQHPRVSVTPHIGASTAEAQSNIGLELADKIIAFYGDDK